VPVPGTAFLHLGDMSFLGETSGDERMLGVLRWIIGVGRFTIFYAPIVIAAVGVNAFVTEYRERINSCLSKMNQTIENNEKPFDPDKLWREGKISERMRRALKG